jgi:molybdopterin converting factor small subunit
VTVTVLVPSALRSDAGDVPRLEIAATGTLESVLRELGERWPRLARRICDEQGQLRKFVNVYVDGEDVRRLAGLGTPVAPGAEVQILPSVAGGCH